MTNEKEYCTVYLLTNKVNGKVYVGQTWLSFEERMQKDGAGYKNSMYLYGALQKYGIENFEYSVLSKSLTQEEADKLEKFYIEKYNSLDHDVGYNLKEGGSAGKHSEETKIKIGKGSKNRIRTNEEMNFIINLGKQWRDKKREPHTSNFKDEISQKMTEWHANNPHPMQGQHHTEEAKLKISEANIGKIRSRASVEAGAQKRRMDPEREQAILKAYQEGKNISEIEIEFDTGRSSIYRLIKRKNIQLLNNFSKWEGKAHSEETKNKMSNSATKIWKERVNGS
jgi:group I intron endonuclease